MLLTPTGVMSFNVGVQHHSVVNHLLDMKTFLSLYCFAVAIEIGGRMSAQKKKDLDQDTPLGATKVHSLLKKNTGSVR